MIYCNTTWIVKLFITSTSITNTDDRLCLALVVYLTDTLSTVTTVVRSIQFRFSGSATCFCAR